MMLTLIILGVYMLGFLATARRRYHIVRPENCALYDSYRHQSSTELRSRWSCIDTQGEAYALAVISGLVWPATWISIFLARVITAAPPPTPAEAAMAERQRQVAIAAAEASKAKAVRALEIENEFPPTE